MFFYPTFVETSILLILYIFIYNFALFFFFWTISQNHSINSKTFYNLSILRNSPFMRTTLTILLFSMAGVPPFLGFFTKILILICLVYTNLFFFYFCFFILLVLSLYFYLQNLRFLHIFGSLSTENHFIDAINLFLTYSYSNIIFLLLFSFGFGLFDDMLVIITWICL